MQYTVDFTVSPWDIAYITIHLGARRKLPEITVIAISYWVEDFFFFLIISLSYILISFLKTCTIIC